MNNNSSLLKSGYILIILSYLTLLVTLCFYNELGVVSIGSTAMGAIHLTGIGCIWLAKRKATDETLKHCAYIIKSFWIYNIAGLAFFSLAIWSAFQMMSFQMDQVTGELSFSFIENQFMSILAIIGNLGVVVFTLWYIYRTGKGTFFYFKNKKLEYVIIHRRSFTEVIKEFIKTKMAKVKPPLPKKAANDE